jgi:hypothetical protein
MSHRACTAPDVPQMPPITNQYKEEEDMIRKECVAVSRLAHGTPPTTPLLYRYRLAPLPQDVDA